MTIAYCPLCASNDTAHFHSDAKRDYRRCACCMLVFVKPEQHLSRSEEKATYDLHENNPSDQGYMAFLSRLAEPMLERIPANTYGLDFGCGPCPALAEVFRASGHTMSLYDPFYADYPEQLRKAYDFVVCTEVVEHFRDPQRDFALLFGLLEPGGWLGIMTKLVIDAEAFAKWHYKNDPTHIAFYSRPTFYWLAKRYDFEVEFIGKDVIIVQRSPHRCND